MLSTLDPSRETFLKDHRVNGVPLLPTVMALDLMARAALRTDPAHDREGCRVAGLRDVVVGPPVTFPGDRAATVEVAVTPAGDGAVDAVLRPAQGVADVPGYTATVLLAPGGRTPAGARAELPLPLPLPMPALGPVAIYPPYFHGPLMQVVGDAGRDGGGLCTRIRTGLAPVGWHDQPTVTMPTLLELWMQSCGLWELAVTGRMMIPSRLGSVSWAGAEGQPAGGGLDGARATVRPRPDARDRTVFDGQVVDRTGAVVLTVTDYSTVDLGHRVAAESLTRVRRALTEAGVAL